MNLIKKLKFITKPQQKHCLHSKIAENNYHLRTQGDIKSDAKKIKRFDLK